MGRLAILSSMSVVLALWAGAAPAGAQGPTVSVLVDFGDGTYLWADVELPETNVTAMKATTLANAAWGLPPLEVSWFDSAFCRRSPCAFVDDVGERDPIYPVWWHLLLWNSSAATWDLAGYGPSDTDLAQGDAIAWYLAVDDPITFASPRPVSTPTQRDVWTSFRGDLSNRGLSRESIPVTGRVAWSTNLCLGTDCPVAEIDAAPVSAYGMVYVVMRERVVALDATTGEIVWSNPTIHGLLSSPTVYDGMLVLGGMYGRLHALDAFTGEARWMQVVEPGGGSTGTASSPAVSLGRAYVGTFNESDGGKGKVVAVSVNDGSVAWEYAAPGVIHMSSPAIRDGNLFVGVMGTYDGGINYTPPFGLLSLTVDGEFRWFFETDGPVAASPVLTDGHAFVTDKAGVLYAIAEDGSLDWRRSIAPSTSSPAVASDRLFAGSGGFNGTGHVWAFDLAGNELWRANVSGPVQASVVTDGRVVCGGTNTDIGVHFCLDTTTGRQVWARSAPGVGPGTYILGSATAAGGTLFTVNDRGDLIAFRDASPGEHALASLHVNADPLRPGSVSHLRIQVGASAALSRVSLRVTLDAGLRLSNETGFAIVPRTFTYVLGEGSAWPPLVLEVVPQEGRATGTVTCALSYRDFADREYPDVEVSETFPVGTPPSAPAFDWRTVAAVTSAAGIVLVLAYLLVRRRGRGPLEDSRDA